MRVSYDKSRLDNKMWSGALFPPEVPLCARCAVASYRLLRAGIRVLGMIK